MKKIKISLLAASALFFFEGVYANQVVPFTDKFDVELNANYNKVAPIITYVQAGHTGGIVAQNYYCDSHSCHFETRDNNGSTANGTVEFLIGASSKGSSASYCDIYIEDGAYLFGGAKLTSYCYNRVNTTPLVHSSEYQYYFNIVDQS